MAAAELHSRPEWSDPLNYAEYLRARARECVKLAVQDPWDGATAVLIDLAQEYRNWAGGVERALAEGRGPSFDEAGGSGLLSGTRRLLGH